MAMVYTISEFGFGVNDHGKALYSYLYISVYIYINIYTYLYKICISLLALRLLQTWQVASGCIAG